jgi:hypothetical protein
LPKLCTLAGILEPVPVDTKHCGRMAKQSSFGLNPVDLNSMLPDLCCVFHENLLNVTGSACLCLAAIGWFLQHFGESGPPMSRLIASLGKRSPVDVGVARRRMPASIEISDSVAISASAEISTMEVVCG